MKRQPTACIGTAREPQKTRCYRIDTVVIQPIAGSCQRLCTRDEAVSHRLVHCEKLEALGHMARPIFNAGRRPKCPLHHHDCTRQHGAIDGGKSACCQCVQSAVRLYSCDNCYTNINISKFNGFTI